MVIDVHLLLAFLAAALALNFTPGADMMFVTAQSLSGGRGTGIAAALGVGSGAVVHSALAALGLAALVAAEPVAFDVIRYAGAAYLIYVAVQMIRTPPRLDGGAAAPRTNLARAYAQGLTTNLLNPKVIVFVLAFLPQFANPASGSLAAQIFILGTLFGVTGTSVLIAVAFAGGRLRRAFAAHPFAGRALGWISGTLIGGLAIGLLLTSRRAA
jgi:threonine/homoserine/homoserine lactone efflux protein